MKKQKVNLCIIGLGRAGQIHLQSLRTIDHFRLKSCVEPDPEKREEVAKNFNCTPLEKIDEALDDNGLDAVLIASPTQLHHDHIIRALEAGKHVFTEKPIGLSEAEIKRCFALANVNALTLFVGFQRRHDKNFNIIKERLSQLGQARSIKISSRDNPPPTLGFLKTSGNIFHDMLLHEFDMLLYLFGPIAPETVYATGHAYDDAVAEIPDFDSVSVTLKFPGGLICTMDGSRMAAYGYDQRFEIFGSEGMAISDNYQEHSVRFYDRQAQHAAPPLYSFPNRYRAAYRAVLEDFGLGVLNGRPNNVSEEECILSHQIADAAMASAMQGEVILFDEWRKSSEHND